MRHEASTFADHWRAKSGKDALKLDWLATWRNWCRNPLAHVNDMKLRLNGNGHCNGQTEMNEAFLAEARRKAGLSPKQEVIDMEEVIDMAPPPRNGINDA